MGPSELVKLARSRSNLSKTAFAAAAGTSRAALDQIEKGQRMPRVDTIARAARAAGLRLTLQLVDDAQLADIATLRSHCRHLATDDAHWTWRWLVGDFMANEFVPATRPQRIAMLANPPEIDDQRWALFAAALAEHLAVHAGIQVPAWTRLDPRAELEPLWWPVHLLPSQRPAALACSPASFKRRGILIDGRELPVVLP